MPLNLRPITAVAFPAAGAIFIGGAFFAGHYIGRHDAEQRQALATAWEQGADAAEKLRVAESALALLRESKSADAARVLDQYAQRQVQPVSTCFKSPDCATWMAMTAEARTMLQGFVFARERPDVRTSP
ncbi:hypothetical protein [Rhizobacter sp. OV335]|jgi:hypothetical protein|uniref:hypothetical protein n=1 Tax=Rhizobacter sp. OV335 TaxID=1500264 RepID=UPI00091E5C7E|nr:hypothetical protein [Rhizobacter sp. OV335]SHM54009.1 hypothetical protein SAMN02787076_01553 [Rhizobacter sp. OV335]